MASREIALMCVVVLLMLVELFNRAGLPRRPDILLEYVQRAVAGSSPGGAVITGLPGVPGLSPPSMTLIAQPLHSRPFHPVPAVHPCT